MRLDEWQKYIDSQFLEDEPEPLVAPPPPTQNEPVKTEAIKTDFVEPECVELEALKTEQAPTPEPFKQVEQDIASLTSNPRPETAPNAIQNVVTLVVAAPPVPVLPANPKPPRIELLTPLPDPPADRVPAPEVTNRTRRRSQAAGASADAAQTPDTAADLLPVPAVASVSKPDTQQASEELFAPLTGMDADIPEFHRYLPASHAAAQSAQNPPRDDARLEVTPFTAPRTAAPPSTLESANGASPFTQAAAALAPASLTFPPVSETSPSPALFRTVEITAPEMDALTADYEIGIDPSPAARDSLPRPAKSRARHARNVKPDNIASGLSASELWATVPRHVQTLLSLERMEETEVAQSSYKRPFQEKRHELIERLLDPILSLEDTARLLNVCPTTVRRYTNKGILTYYRKEPERAARMDAESGESEKETRQRRFRLSDILAFLETQQAAIAADRQAERRQSRVETTSLSDALQDPSTVSPSAAAGEGSAENSVTFRPMKDV